MMETVTSSIVDSSAKQNGDHIPEDFNMLSVN